MKRVSSAETACGSCQGLPDLYMGKRGELAQKISCVPRRVQASKRVFLLDPCRIRTDDRQMPTKRGWKPDDRSLLCYHCTKGPGNMVAAGHRSASHTSLRKIPLSRLTVHQLVSDICRCVWLERRCLLRRGGWQNAAGIEYHHTPPSLP